MKILHITPSSNGYEEVELVANRISRKNGLVLIRRDGIEFMTGGYLMHDNPVTRKALDQIPKNEQYEFMIFFRSEPFVKDYHEEQL